MADVKGINFNSLSIEQLNRVDVTDNEKKQMFSIFQDVDNKNGDEDKRAGFISGKALSDFYSKLASAFDEIKLLNLLSKIKETYAKPLSKEPSESNADSLIKDYRKLSAKENYINERANATYSKNEISNITKEPNVVSLLMQNNLVTNDGNGGYSIKNLSNYLRKFADLENNYSDKDSSMNEYIQSITPDVHRIQNLKQGLLSDYGIEITDKIAKDLIQFCGYSISRQ